MMKNFSIGMFFALSVLLLSSLTHATSTAIFLSGTGSAGKTSLCKALIQSDPSWKLIDEDALYFDKAVLFLRDLFPQEFSYIDAAVAAENLFHAVLRNQILFKDSATAQEKIDASIAIYGVRKRFDLLMVGDSIINGKWRGIKTSIAHDTVLHIEQGGNIIIDSLGFIKPQDAEQAGYKVVRILMYCPLKDIVNRTLQRNVDALLRRRLLSMRYYSHLLTGFINLYDFKEKSDDSIDSITREEVNNVLDVVELLLPLRENINCFTRAEFSREQFNEYRENFMKKFVNTDVLYIAPKDKFDLCVRTDRDDATNLIEQINALRFKSGYF